MSLPDHLHTYTTLELAEAYQDHPVGSQMKDYALTQLILRYRNPLLKKCEIICDRHNLDVSVAEEITNIVFEKYGLKPNYSKDKVNANSHEEGFELYLLGIARREVVNYTRKQERLINGYNFTGEEQIVTELPKIDESALSLEAQVRFQAIKALPKALLIVYLTYSKYETKGFNLPRTLLKQLRDFLGVKQSTIRTYKLQAQKSIDDHLKGMQITKNKDNGNIT